MAPTLKYSSSRGPTRAICSALRTRLCGFKTGGCRTRFGLHTVLEEVKNVFGCALFFPPIPACMYMYKRWRYLEVTFLFPFHGYAIGNGRGNGNGLPFLHRGLSKGVVLGVTMGVTLDDSYGRNTTWIVDNCRA